MTAVDLNVPRFPGHSSLPDYRHSSVRVKEERKTCKLASGLASASMTSPFSFSACFLLQEQFGKSFSGGWQGMCLQD